MEIVRIFARNFTLENPVDENGNNLEIVLGPSSDNGIGKRCVTEKNLYDIVRDKDSKCICCGAKPGHEPNCSLKPTEEDS